MRSHPAGFLLLLCYMLFPGQSLGFYEHQDENSFLELRGFLGLGAGYLSYPPHSIYRERDDFPWTADLRLLVDSDHGEGVHLTANILQSTRAKLSLDPAIASLLPNDVKRSSILTWEQHDTANSRSEIVVDVLNLQYRTTHVDYAFGRQPINLGTTFYFVPNDFFAPFAPQAFFRAYKPGVDALRGDIRLAELSQLTLLAVLSYEMEKTSPDTWQKEPDWRSTSFLGRVTKEKAGFEWGLLAGTVNDFTIAGGSLQGDIFGEYVLRAEGHYGDPETNVEKSYYKLSIGIEKLYANNFNWRLEYFQNSNADAGVGAGVFTANYQDRDYGALGMGYEVTPLMTVSFIALANINDSSWLFSGNLLYSLSDESELSLVLSAPVGHKPTPTDPGSEFGHQPEMALLEYRAYF